MSEFKPVLVTRSQDLLSAFKDERERRGLTQDALDHRAGLTRGHIGKIEGGNKPWAKQSFQMTVSVSWALEALGLALVLVPVEKARELVGECVSKDLTVSYQPRSASQPLHQNPSVLAVFEYEFAEEGSPRRLR